MVPQRFCEGLCGASKGFVKAFKAFIKLFAAPQKSVKIKVSFPLISGSGQEGLSVAIKMSIGLRFNISLTLYSPTPKKVKHTQTIRRLLPMNCLSVLDRFVGLTRKGLITKVKVS